MPLIALQPVSHKGQVIPIGDPLPEDCPTERLLALGVVGEPPDDVPVEPEADEPPETDAIEGEDAEPEAEVSPDEPEPEGALEPEPEQPKRRSRAKAS